MGVVRMKVYVAGMTCPACESRISKSLLALDGVKDARSQVRGGIVEVEFDEALIDLETIKTTIEKVGYAIRGKRDSSTKMALGIGAVLAALYLLASSSGLFNALPKVDASIGYAMLFVVGLLTSIHCVAMCGGIALSQSIRRSDEGAAAESPSDKFRRLTPGLLYNAGRILSYTVIGGIVGALGAAFSFSPVARGAIAGLAGLFMVVFGLRMLGLLKGGPRLARLVPARLRAVGTKTASALRSRGPFAIGVLNGFMPCGPLQTMQLYALGTGSALAGATSMFIFSVGTAPLMLVFGLTAALLPRKFVPVMLKASAVLVMFLGVVTFGRAAALSGIPLPDISVLSSTPLGTEQSASIIPVGSAASKGGLAVIENGVQTITTDFVDGYYVPFTVQAGIPLRWTIRIKEEDINGCNNPVEVPGYRIRKTLVSGDNVIEFTPTKEGTIPYSCWMGMIRSRITVVKDLAALGSDASSTAKGGGGSLNDLLGGGGLGGRGGCCSGTTNPEFAGGRVPSETIGMPVIKDGIQEITITVGNDGYSPAAFVLQKGMKAVIKFKGEATSCNSPVVFPEYNGALDLTKGQLETPAIPITGDFTFQCWMGMLHGYVKAVDDLAKVDIAKVRTEIQDYRATGSGGGAGAGGCCGGAPLGAN